MIKKIFRILVDGRDIPIQWFELRRGACPDHLILTLVTDSEKDPNESIYEFLKQPQIREISIVSRRIDFPRFGRVTKLDNMRGHWIQSIGANKLLIFANFKRLTAKTDDGAPRIRTNGEEEAWESSRDWRPSNDY